MYNRIWKIVLKNFFLLLIVIVLYLLATKLGNYQINMAMESSLKQLSRQNTTTNNTQSMETKKPRLETKSHEHELNKSSKVVHNTETLKTLNKFPKCPSVLDKMVYGSWIVKSITNKQKIEIETFLEKSRTMHALPRTLQRNDSMCGNVTFHMHSIYSKWFRALCDPKGKTPCCYNNQCVEKSIEQCQCDNCFDMRQPIHAEYSDWIPYDRRCQIKIYNHLEACELLSGSTLAVIGDSYIRHIYTALLLFLRNNTVDGALRKGVPKEIYDQCTGMYIFTEKVCRLHLDNSNTGDICGGKVKLNFRYFYNSDFGEKLASFIKSKGLVKEKTLLVFGIGLHDKFNSERIGQKYVQPLMRLVKTMTWPKLLWVSPHCPGILKNGQIEAQSKTAVNKFMREMEYILSPQNIPIFNTYNMTDGTMSFDGNHYGLGMNMWKVQILLNYIQELKDKGHW